MSVRLRVGISDFVWCGWVLCGCEFVGVWRCGYAGMWICVCGYVVVSVRARTCMWLSRGVGDCVCQCVCVFVRVGVWVGINEGW